MSGGGPVDPHPSDSVSWQPSYLISPPVRSGAGLRQWDFHPLRCAAAPRENRGAGSPLDPFSARGAVNDAAPDPSRNRIPIRRPFKSRQ